MRLRFLILGLTAFATAMVLAALPVLGSATTSYTPYNKPCTIKGTPSNDYLLGTPSANVICGGGGNDVISGAGGNDIIRGGGGDDTDQGDAGSDRVIGGHRPGNNFRLHRNKGPHLGGAGPRPCPRP